MASKKLLDGVASIIADYRKCEIEPPDADHVNRWISQFDAEGARPDFQRDPACARTDVHHSQQCRTRADWEHIRVRVMRWSLRVKLAQNQTTFGQLLLATGNKPIVEESAKDQFWGAKVQNGDALMGVNVLGRLLMELREQLRAAPSAFEQVSPPQIPNFLLFGQPVETVRAKTEPGTLITHRFNQQPLQHKVKISGTIGKNDWESLLHLLASSDLSPEGAFLKLELRFSPDAADDPRIKMLAEMARKFGIRFHVL